MAERTPTVVRLSTAGRARVDEIATSWKVSRSEAIRLILGAAVVDSAWLNKVKPNPKEM